MVPVKNRAGTGTRAGWHGITSLRPKSERRNVTHSCHNWLVVPPPLQGGTVKTRACRLANGGGSQRLMRSGLLSISYCSQHQRPGDFGTMRCSTISRLQLIRAGKTVSFTGSFPRHRFLNTALMYREEPGRREMTLRFAMWCLWADSDLASVKAPKTRGITLIMEVFLCRQNENGRRAA